MPKSLEAPRLTNKQKKRIFIASGSTHPRLAKDAAKAIGLRVGKMERRPFASTELYVRYGESVRGKHVFAVQAHAAHDERSINDSIVEHVLMVDAAKRASARRITAVVPLLGYARQDRKARGREPISAKAVVRMLEAAGADRIVTADMHSPQAQGFFDGPFDHLTAEPLLLRAIKKAIKGDSEEYCIASPDVGRAKIAERYSKALGLDLVHVPKGRSRKGHITRPPRVEGVGGRICFLIDDMIDTAGTTLTASTVLDDSGAASVYAAATHGIFSEPAPDRLKRAPIKRIFVTDTVPQDEAIQALDGQLKVVRIGSLIGQSIGEIATYGSISKMFRDQNYS